MHSIASICKLGVKTLPLLYPLQTYTTYEPLQSYSSVGISPFSADCLLIAANYLNPSLGFLKAAFFLFLFSFYVLHCARPEHCYRCQPNSVCILGSCRAALHTCMATYLSHASRSCNSWILRWQPINFYILNHTKTIWMHLLVNQVIPR